MYGKHEDPALKILEEIKSAMDGRIQNSLKPKASVAVEKVEVEPEVPPMEEEGQEVVSVEGGEAPPSELTPEDMADLERIRSKLLG